MSRAVILIIHLLAILAPVFAGWGFNDLPEFFHESARALFIAAILLGGLAILLFRIDLNPLRTGTPARSGESRTLLVLTVCAIVLLAFLPYADRHHILMIGHPTLRLFSRWLGLILTIGAGVVRILALRQLGSQFSAYVTLQPRHKLIQSGIYARIRHPLYLSLLLAGPGVALIFGSQLVWLTFTAAVLFTGNRIVQEDALLQQAFPDAFPSYRNKTNALLPGLL